MTIVDEAIERLRALPAADQESAAETVLEVIAQYEQPYRLTPEQVAEVRRLSDDLDAGRLDVLSEAEAEAMWKRLGA